MKNPARMESTLALCLLSTFHDLLLVPRVYLKVTLFQIVKNLYLSYLLYFSVAIFLVTCGHLHKVGICLKLRLHGQLLQCHFQRLLRYRCVEKIATWLHGEQEKFADRKIARILRVFNFSVLTSLSGKHNETLLHVLLIRALHVTFLI